MKLLNERQIRAAWVDYMREVAAEADNYNRLNNTEFTASELQSRRLLKFNTFEDYLCHKYPGYARTMEAWHRQEALRQRLLHLPLRERLRREALFTLTRVVRAHANNLQQMEAELELELELEGCTGMFS